MVASILATIPNSEDLKSIIHFMSFIPSWTLQVVISKLLLKYTRQGPTLPSITGATVYETCIWAQHYFTVPNVDSENDSLTFNNTWTTIFYLNMKH